MKRLVVLRVIYFLFVDKACSDDMTSGPEWHIIVVTLVSETRRLHRRSLRLPTRRKWAQSGYLCSTPSTAHAEADAGISWS